MRFLQVILTVLLWSTGAYLQADNTVDMVIFSYDRPLQLYAFLESTYRYISGINSIQVVYRTSNESFKKGYNVVARDFSDVVFVPQSEQPQKDFKLLMCEAVYGASAEYVIFAVDDIIVTDFVDLNKCIDALETNDAYGFFLRLGKNIIARDFGNIQQKYPCFKVVGKDIVIWFFDDGGLSWRYPHTVDMTLYKKSSIKNDLYMLSFTSPNTLENVWSHKAPNNNRGLCFTESKIVNVPLNRVQNDIANKSMNLYSSRELLNLFNQGYKIDINKLYQFSHVTPHVWYEPTFVIR